MAKHFKQIEIACQYEFTPFQTLCPKCAGPFWITYHTSRRIMTLQGMCHLSLIVRRCQNAECFSIIAPIGLKKRAGGLCRMGSLAWT